MRLRTRRVIARLTLLAFFLATPFTSLACASTRPVHKIGLLAPFEGLERRTGYDALAAMRTALDEASPAGVDLLPAALDTSQDVRRASQKLFAGGETRQGEQTLIAVVGPFSPQAASAISDVVAAASLPWILPFAMTTEGFAQLADPQWAADLLSPIVAAAHSLKSDRLALAGWTPGWPERQSPLWHEIATLPFVFLDKPEDVQKGDAVIWLGDADEAARFLSALRTLGLPVSFWLALSGDDPVFLERSQEVAPNRWGDVFYAKWAQATYNDEQTPPPTLPWPSAAADAATRTAIAQTVGSAASTQGWAVHIYRLSHAGQSTPMTFGE